MFMYVLMFMYVCMYVYMYVCVYVCYYMYFIDYDLSSNYKLEWNRSSFTVNFVMLSFNI